MTCDSFCATAWSNGGPSDTVTGYGLRITTADRDRFFQREWTTVRLRLASIGTSCEAIVCVAKPSFWNGCRELIGKEIGQWFIECGFAPWPKGNPPRFRITPAGRCAFDVEPAEWPSETA